MFVYPFSFEEYLMAIGEQRLLDAKRKANVQKPLTDPVHWKLITHMKRFLVLGGMPEVISTYVRTSDLLRCGQALDDLVASLKVDFAKYRSHIPFLRISEVFDSVVQQAGGKFVYAKAAATSNHKQIKEALDLLIMAGLVIPVTHTAANGLPLGAEINPKNRKMMLLDTGISQRLLGLKIGGILVADDFDAINKGAIAEQYVGLELLKYSSCYRQESLYFWHRESKSSNAEVDYILQKEQQILPIEVKSGKSGSMQSLRLFMREKKSKTGVRFSLENYSEYENIKVFPLYAINDLINSPE
jgi:hypothetical protein